jgi:STE24 endopeptidase
MHAVSRHFEWQADRFACELQDKLADDKMSDMGERLGRALITLHVKNLSTVWVDWLCVFHSLSVDRRAYDPADTRRTTTRTPR